MTSIAEKVIALFESGPLKEWFVERSDFLDRTGFLIKPEGVIPVFRTLRDDPELQFNFLADLCAVDYLAQGGYIEMVWHLHSLANNYRIKIKCRLADGQPVASLTPLYKTANWQERETWDLMGVRFEGHPDLRRIQLWEGFEGHPLRKDYPLQGRRGWLPKGKQLGNKQYRRFDLLRRRISKDEWRPE